MPAIRARAVYPAKTPQPNSPSRMQVPATQKNSATNTVVAVMKCWRYPTNYVTIMNFAIWPRSDSGYLRPRFSDDGIWGIWNDLAMVILHDQERKLAQGETEFTTKVKGRLP